MGLGSEQAGAINRSEGEAQHYGQEISKFYGGGNSGEAERNRFLQAKITYGSGPAQAGVLRGERDLITGRFDQIYGNIARLMGEEEAQRQLARAQVPEQIERINRSIAKLDPNGPEAKSLRGAAAPQAPQGGKPAPQQSTAGLDPISQARAAIAQGANRDLVITRLRMLGINPAGL
jgi:hypothetical protein